MTLQSAMTPRTYTPSTLSTYSYCITQPFVLLRYFGSLFLPIHLNVDTDLQPFSALTSEALAGFFFVALLLAAAGITMRNRTLRPIAFGLLWFLIASLPTSLYRLSEVENDHRMYLPLVGLVLAVAWAAFLAIERLASGKIRVFILQTASLVAIALLALYGYGAHVRNQVWRTDESLWLDDVQKSPHNGRGLMNYGLTQMAKGAYPVALDYFRRAQTYTPNYKTLEINLGVVQGAMHNDAEAERHFQHAIALAPADDEPHFYYGRWLYDAGRISDALPQLELAVQRNPSRLATRDLLTAALVTEGDTVHARAVAEETLRLEPGDTTVNAVLSRSAAQAADYWINASLYQYQSGNYDECIKAAKQALHLKPDSKLAYNNIGAAYAGLHEWNLAVESEQQALRIDPDFTIAKNNLALYASHSTESSKNAGTMTPEDWLNASLRDNQAGAFQKSIQDARAALRLRPNFPEAYNNIAAGYASLHQWDLAVAAAQEAIRLKPDYQLAKNNLAWAISERQSEK
jgi:tetratricopeptide (TPR) repeat protein